MTREKREKKDSNMHLSLSLSGCEFLTGQRVAKTNTQELEPAGSKLFDLLFHDGLQMAEVKQPRDINNLTEKVNASSKRKES